MELLELNQWIGNPLAHFSESSDCLHNLWMLILMEFEPFRLSDGKPEDKKLFCVVNQLTDPDTTRRAASITAEKTKC